MTRDPTVTDTDRTEMLALAAYEAHVHQACGFHASQIEDPDAHPLVPDRFKCPFCAANARQSRVWAEEDRLLERRVGKPPSGDRAGERYPTDGVTRFLRPATPDEIAQHQSRGGDRG